MRNSQKNQADTKVIFVGGNNDVGIGANCIVVESTNDKGETTRIMLDLGMKLTVDDPNYDGIVPDIRDYLDKVDEEGNVIESAKYPTKAVFITHAHEDHRGGFNSYEALGYRTPVKFAGSVTAKIERNRINREGINPNVADGQRVLSVDEMPNPRVGFASAGIEVEAFAVSHSAVNSKGYHVLIKQPNGKDLGLLFTGDYNMREMQSSFNGKADGFNETEYLDLISRKPVTHIFHDSTSSGSSDEFIFSKDTCINQWKELIGQVEKDGRAEIFTENIANSVDHLLKLGQATREFNSENNRNRKIFIDSGNLGLAYQAYINSGGDSFEDVIFMAEGKGAADSYKKEVKNEDRIVVFSGVFAEGAEDGPITKSLKMPSGVVKLSKAEKIVVSKKTQKNNKQNDEDKGSKTGHRSFAVGPNTAYIKAQRDVGINSKAIRKTINKIAALGAKIYQVATYPEASMGNNYPMYKIQSSGHASKAESQKFMAYHNPENTVIIPIHGDTEQLKTTAKIAKEIGFKANVYKNANVIDVFQGGSRLVSENQDENKYLAFRNEGTLQEKVLVIDEVAVYPDHKNPKVEHICYMDNLGKHTAKKVDGKWTDSQVVDGADVEENGQLNKKQLRNSMKRLAKEAYFRNKGGNNI